MPDLLGITSLLFVALCVLVCGQRWPALSKILWVAFAARVGAVLFHQYVMPLPDSGADAHTFECYAAELAKTYGTGIFSQFTGSDSYLISRVIGVVYVFAGRSPMMAQAISVALGTATVYLVYRLALILWDQRAAVKAGWVAALFPTFILYSALTMREPYIWFFLILALLGVVQWIRSGGFKPLLLATGGFIGATLFHGAMLIGALVFFTIVIFRVTKQQFFSISRGRIRIFGMVTLILSLVPVGGYILGIYAVPKLGNIERVTDVTYLMQRFGSTTRSSGDGEDGATYPSWTVPKTLGQLPWKGFIRSAYFLFSPFPWDVKRLSHLLGVFDAVLYMVLFFFLWRNRKAVWADPATRTLLLIFAAYIFVFGIAIGNSGTGIRHRAKFVAILIVLAAPKIWKIQLAARKPTLKKSGEAGCNKSIVGSN